MSKGQMLRAFVEQRLTVAAAEIFGLFERTIAEYEEELTRSKEENERQRRQLDAVVARQLRLQRADVQQLNKEEVSLDQQVKSSGLDQEEPQPPLIKKEQQEWSISLDQEDPEPPHIKEEQEKLCTNQEGEQLHAVEQDDIIPLILVSVKSEDDDEERLQSSQLHQRQTEQMETEADGEDCGGPEPAENSDPNNKTEAENQHSDGWKKTRQPQSGLKCSKNDNGPDCNLRWGTCENPFTCTECGKIFNRKECLKRHIRTHTGEKPFPCSVCKKSFAQRGNLQTHMRIHTGEKPFNCSLCNKSFALRQLLERHMRTHTGEKPFSCFFCDKSFAQRQQLVQHMIHHT